MCCVLWQRRLARSPFIITFSLTMLLKKKKKESESSLALSVVRLPLLHHFVYCNWNNWWVLCILQRFCIISSLSSLLSETNERNAIVLYAGAWWNSIMSLLLLFSLIFLSLLCVTWFSFDCKELERIIARWIFSFLFDLLCFVFLPIFIFFLF